MSIHGFAIIFLLSHFELMLFSVDDDGCDLLIHEQQDGQEQGGDGGRDVDVPRRALHDERNDPASNIGPRRLNKNLIRGLFMTLWY